MEVVVDSAGRSLMPQRPAGYIDPVYLSVSRPRADVREPTVVLVERWQGTRGQRLHCVVSMEPPTPVACRVVQAWIS
jgi:hypothetical protein